ncbi:MAG: right-handed parallel beta-helix repeat-containing protein, partial [Methanoregula sp.]|nr:right-handed parallel beta-helix repeat-containing protein [Methanoregula sp.]
MRHTSKTRSLFLLMGLVISTMLLLGVVSATASTPSITVTAPNGGETWQRGTSHTVAWDYTGTPGSTVKILLLKSGTEVGTIAASVPIGTGGKGSYTWPIYYATPGSDFKVSVQSTSQPTIKDVSNTFFSLTSPATTPSITVTSPKGGETWQRGTSHTIAWDYTGTPGSTVKILLLKSGTEVGTIAASVPIGTGGKGSYTWPIYYATPGSDFKVSVQSTSQQTIKDVSNTFFSLTSSTPVITPTASTPASNTINTVPAGSSALYLDQFGIKGDGSDETAKLQSAFNYARDHSIRTVVFPQNKIIAITSMVRIWGGLTVIGNGATIKRKDYSAIYPGSMVSVWDGSRVSGLIIDGNYWADDYGNPENYADNGVILGSNVVFDKNEVKNVRAYSIEVYGDSNVVITNNKIHDSYQYGIDTGGGVGGESYNITVTGNTIYNCQQVGIKIRGTHGAVIRNNTITMPENSQFARGISLYSFDLPNDDILIDSNTITGSFKGGNMDGISSDDSQNTRIRITNNIVSKCDVGIDLHFTGGTVTGNKISECSTSIAGASGNIVANNILTTGNSSNSEQTPVVTPTVSTPVIKPSISSTPSLSVTSPNGGESWDRSISQTLTWSYTGNPGSTVKIVLLKGGTAIGTIAESVPIGSGGKGSYSWLGWTGRVPG